MKIPNKIKIGWRNFKIIDAKRIEDEDGAEILGHINFNKNTIVLADDGVGEDSKKLILLHEIIHGLFNSLGRSKENNDEDLVNGIAETLFQVIKDNPKLIEYIGNYKIVKKEN